MIRAIQLEIAYDGTQYYGWQRQAGFPTIQEQIEAAIVKVTSETSPVEASGRTDTGVHAFRQIAHFQTQNQLPADTLLRALNANLPPDISIRNCVDVAQDFHARFHALAKRYLYVVNNSPTANPLMRNYAYWIPYALDLARMQQAAQALVGTHDFTSFANTDKNSRNPTKTIYSYKIVSSGEKLLFIVEGSGFLMHMVRIMVGTLLRVGQKKISPTAIVDMLKAKDRSVAGPTAPARGLFLVRVLYSGRRRQQ